MEEPQADPEADPAPKLTFAQVVSPGLYGTVALGGPFLLGAGVSLSPGLREVTDRDAKVLAPALRAGFFISVDVPLFPLN